MPLCKKKTQIFSVLFLVFGVYLADAIFAPDSKAGELINCDIQNQSCIQGVKGGSILFDIQPKPVKAMQNLTFKIQVKNVNLTGPPVIDLSMPGMKMGPNRVLMKMTAAGVYQGTGIIVRCPSGNPLWKASVNLPGTGPVNFIFNVVY